MHMKLTLLLIMAISTKGYAAQIASPSGYSREPTCDFSSICLKHDIWQLRQNDEYAAIRELVSKWARYESGWLNRLEWVMQGVLLFTVSRADYGLTEVLLVRNEEGVWVPEKEAHIVY